MGTLSNGPKADTAEQYCNIIPFADNYGKFSSYFPSLRDILEDRSVGAPSPPTPSGQDLTSGVAARFSINAVSGATLFNGANSYRITVPQGATRLDIVLSTSTPDADLDLFARFGQDVALSSGRAVADHRSEGPTGNEQIAITAATDPPLRAGTYFISLALFSNGLAVNGTLTATVTTSTVPPPSSVGQTVLTSGVARNVTIAPLTAATLLTGARGFKVDVPEGATRLDVRLSSTTLGADLDLFVRFGSDVTLSAGTPVADYRSTGNTADEFVSISSASTPPLKAGTYFISLGIFTLNASINVTLTATVTTAVPPPFGGAVLTSGRPQSFTLEPVGTATLFNGSLSYTIVVPQGATRLDIVLATSTPNVDIDLFARASSDTTLASGSVVADHRAEGPTGNEQITITAAGAPALRAGTYFISLAMFTTGVHASGTLTATVTTGAIPPPASGPTVLTSGRRQTYSLPVAAQATLYNGNAGFVIDVAPNARRLDIQLTTATPGADVDLFMRFNADLDVSEGAVVSDYGSTGPDGSERITVTTDSSPPLRPGRYYISLAAFTTNLEITGSLVATVTTASTAIPAPAAPVTMTSGVASKFVLPAVDSSTLFNGNYSFKIQVPDGATQMRVQLTSDNPAIDTDLYVRYQSDTNVEDGSVVADYASEGSTGNEVITITSASSPPLRPGVYFISLALFAKGVPSTGSILATIDRGPVVPPTSSAREITSGTPVTYSLPAVTTPTLFGGDFVYRITVGSQHTRLAISVRNDPSSIDVDLLARFGQETSLSGGSLTSDFRSASDGGNEDIVISGSNLRPGVYFINLALFTTGTPAKGTLTATLSSGGSVSAPVLVSGVNDGMKIEPKKAWAVAEPLPVKAGESKETLWLEGELVKERNSLKKRQPVTDYSQ